MRDAGGEFGEQRDEGTKGQSGIHPLSLCPFVPQSLISTHQLFLDQFCSQPGVLTTPFRR